MSKPTLPNKNRCVTTLAWCDVWRRGVVFAVGPDDLVAEAILKTYGVAIPQSVRGDMADLEKTGGQALTASTTGINDILIWAPHPVGLPCLVHECVHAATKILEYVGADDSDEARAYLTEYLFGQFSAVTSCVRSRSSQDGASSRKAGRSGRFSHRGLSARVSASRLPSSITSFRGGKGYQKT